MHPALHIHEIADAVVSLSQRPDLASLARTCRWLSEPALEVLWESPQPWDLALRMRPELWAVTSDLDDDEEEDWSEYGGEQPFCGMLSLSPFAKGIAPAELDLGGRFAYYAKRVRRMILDDTGHDSMVEPVDVHDVDVDVYALWATRTDLFPRLNGLDIYHCFLEHSPAHEALLPAFLRPSVMHALSFSISLKLPGIFSRHRDTLVASCTQLRCLSIYDSTYIGTYDKNGSVEKAGRWAALARDMLSEAAYIQEIHLDIPLQYTDLVRLSTVPSLVKLNVQSVISVPDILRSLPKGAFARLINLELRDDTSGARLTLHLLTFEAQAGFASCRLYIDADISLDTACIVLRQVSSHTSLRSISVDLFKLLNIASTLSETTAMLGALRPSDQLRLLTLSSLYNGGKTRLPLDVMHFKTVCSLYPRLERWAWHFPSYPPPFRLSLDTLLRLLQPYPQLVWLPVMIDSPDVPPVEVRTRFGSRDDGNPLDIAVTKEADTAELRAALSDLFPRANVPRGFIS